MNTKNLIKSFLLVAMMSVSSMTYAQRYQSMYAVRGQRVMFDGREIRYADPHTFQILGYGYAKDRNNVYLDGQILRFVDPVTFRLHGNPHHDPNYDHHDAPHSDIQPVATGGHG
ncbi:MAG: DKNYY domain-containing protein, partial [Bacteroidaceae bacterium]|nr:DKNYY domain-containing protein [Bacteroidaceae bacterium]